MRKYEFTGNKKTIDGTVVREIVAVRDFGAIKEGEMGGYIESEENLSHEGDCWIENEAVAMGNSRVCDDALLSDYAIIKDRVELCDKAMVYDNARISGDVSLSGHSRVIGNAKVSGNVRMYDRSVVAGYCIINGDIRLSNSTYVSGYARIDGEVIIKGRITVEEYARIFGKVIIDGKGTINANAEIGNFDEFIKIKTQETIGLNAKITKPDDFLIIGPIGSRKDNIIFYKSRDGEIFVRTGCFVGDSETFREKVIFTHGNSKHAQLYLKAIEMAKLQIEGE